MQTAAKATRIQLFNFTTPQMRAFHMSWVAFFLCFMGWFAIAPLGKVIKKDLGLSSDQMYNTFIASVGITIFARLLIGVFCDRFGPRKTYTWLMLLGGVAVMSVGLATDYVTFFIARVFIGMIGASFVITQFHSSQMFATNCVGTANALGAGWGNMGAGATNAIMPFITSAFVAWGVSEHLSWRFAMIVPGVVMLMSGVAYYVFTQDSPAGNFDELRARGESIENSKKAVKGGFWIACKDYRVWILAFVYAACFGVEVVMHGTASDEFQKIYPTLDLNTAGLIAGAFGGMAIFARGLGGYISDKVANNNGLKGRVVTLAVFLLGQGIAMVLLAQSTVLAGSVTWLIVFGLFVHMAAGGTYAVLPFINKKVLGSVAGIVGAGGNVGAMLGGLTLRFGVGYWKAITYFAICVLVSGFSAFLIRFKTEDETVASAEFAAGKANNAAPSMAPATLAAGQ